MRPDAISNDFPREGSDIMIVKIGRRRSGDGIPGMSAEGMTGRSGAAEERP